MLRSRFFVGLAALLLWGGCSVSHTAPDGGGGGGGADAAPPDGTTGADDSGMTSDDGSDGGVDIVAAVAAAAIAYQRGDTSIDLDGDGRKEWTLAPRNPGDIPSTESADIDGDGKPEFKFDRTTPTQEYWVDANQDGTPDFDVKATADATTMSAYDVVVLMDTTGDFKIDTRESYTLDPAQTMITVTHEESTNEDGNFDVSYTITRYRDPPGFGPQVPTGGAGDCSPDQANMVQAAFDQMLQNATTCLDRVDGHLAWAILHVVATTNIVITCDAPASVNGQTECGNSGIDVSGASPIPLCKIVPWLPCTRDIHLSPNAFDPNACPGGLAGTLFHEVAHQAFGSHLDDGHQVDDPGDQIRGCQRMCFANGGKCDCYQCTHTCGNPSCNAVYGTAGVCKPQQAYCTCTGTWYTDPTQCPVSCGGGLGCFGSARCKTRGCGM